MMYIIIKLYSILHYCHVQQDGQVVWGAEPKKSVTWADKILSNEHKKPLEIELHYNYQQ